MSVTVSVFVSVPVFMPVSVPVCVLPPCPLVSWERTVFIYFSPSRLCCICVIIRADMDMTAAFALLAERAAASHEDRCAFCQPAAGTPLSSAIATALADSPPAHEPATLSSLLRLVIAQQDRRALEYRRFEDGFLCFMQVAEAEGYTALVADATAAFSQISSRINQAEERLRGLEEPAAVSDGGGFGGGGAAARSPRSPLVRRLQEQEQEKLSLTAQLHIVRHGILVDELRMRHASGEGEEEDMVAASAGPGEDGVAGTASILRTLALRREEDAELRQKLGALEEEISELVDEMRCELAELVEQEE